MQVMRDQEEAARQYLEHEKMRTDRLNRYRDDIKKQIEDKQRQLLKEKLQGNYATSYDNLSYQEIQKRLCDSCDK